MANPNLTFALVTGASQGFGKELAIELARRRCNLLLVSLPNEGLKELSDEFQNKYKIQAYYFETDLREHNSVYEVFKWATSGHSVKILINNAGIGGSWPFEHASIESLESMIQINVRAVTLLTRLLLPELQSHKKSYILNVASMASFSPMAYKTIYPASKTFVYSFSRSLNQELKGSGVSVSVVNPGPMKTNAEVIGRIEGQNLLARLSLVSTHKAAKIAIDGLLQEKALIIPGIYNKLLWFLMKIVPLNFRLSMVSDIMKQEAQRSRQLRIQKGKLIKP